MARFASALLVGLLLSGAVAGCRADDGDGSTRDRADGDLWAQEAEVWFEALFEAAERGGALAATPFFTEDIEIDTRTVDDAGRPFVGWDDAYAHYWQEFHVAGQQVWRQDSVFLDVGGSVNLGTRVPPNPVAGLLVTSASVINLEIGREGIGRQILTLSTSHLVGFGHGDEITRGAERVAEAWVETWTSGDAAAFTALYTPAARVGDSVRRLHLIGPADLATRSELEAIDWSLDRTVDGYPAVFAYASSRDRLDGLLLVAVGDRSADRSAAATDEAACPGRQAIWLTLADDGRVLDERRFWSVDDARRCADPASLPAGWWTTTPLPASARAPHENLDRVTSRLDVGGEPVEIRNGSPTLQLLIDWAVTRFDRAGMALPRFGSVTFSRHRDYCEEIHGRAIPVLVDDQIVSWDLVLCFDEDSACVDASCDRFSLVARRAILHELAHTWISANVGTSQRNRFLADRGLDTWNDQRRPWEERGVEWAAETIAWGLLDEPFSPTVLGNPPTEVMADGFRLLTGLQPLRPDR